MHLLFQSAVDQRIVDEDKLSITLSGGLDSRALLAAAASNKFDIKTFTFGEENCLDVTIARQASDVAGAEHAVKVIDKSNWLHGRDKGIKKTGGLKSMLHMHAMSSFEDIATHSPVLLNGYVGDLVLGGSFLKKNRLDQAVAFNDAQKAYGKYAKDSLYDDEYFSFPSLDPFFLYNRGIRFTSLGSDLGNDLLQHKKPFMDNKLLEFVYSLPDKYRLNGKVYYAMLLKHYPDYFATIPWQKTGKPLAKKTALVDIKNELKKLIKKTVKGSPLEKIGRSIVSKNTKDFASYYLWMKNDEFYDYLNDLLMVKSDLVRKIDEKFIADLVLNFKKGEESAVKLGCLLTVLKLTDASFTDL